MGLAPARRPAQSLLLKTSAHLVQMEHHLDIGSYRAVPPVGAPLHQALGVEPLQRLPYGRARYREDFAQSLLAKRHVDGELARDQPTLQLSVCPVAP